METQVHIFQKLRKVFRGEILINEPLSKHTSFRIGGPADMFLYPKDMEDLSALVDFSRREGIPFFVIGNGSNLLISDDGFRGMVLSLAETFAHINCKGYTLTAGAGVPMSDLLRYCTERGLSGFEPLVGIPGQVGGMLRLNAGAFGSEICDHLKSVHLLDSFGIFEKRSREDITVGYRYADFPNNAVLVEAQFFLAEGNPKEMEALQNKWFAERKKKQPLSLPSAGSVFKRPPGDYAGRLIEEAGCKGLRIGDAMVSKKHANFIVNCHFASAQDVLRLMDEVRNRVLKRFGIELSPEIHMIGFNER